MHNQIPLVFISHSPEDVVWRNKLQTMLAPLVNTGKDYQPAHDVTKPLNSLSDGEQDQVLLEICQEIASVANNTSIGIVGKSPHNSADANQASIGIVNQGTNEKLIKTSKIPPYLMGYLRGLVQMSPQIAFSFAGLHTLEEVK